MVPASAPILLAACLFLALTHILLLTRKESVSPGYRSRSQERTLVVHVFADADPEYLENLKFFVQYGILHQDNAEHIILVQTDTSDIVSHA